MERVTARDMQRAFPNASALDEADLQALIDVCTPVHLLDNSLIFDTGDRSDAFFLVISGRVRVERMLEDGERLALGLLARGHIVGDMGVLTGQPRSASAVVDVELRALRLHAATYDDLRHEGHPAALWLLAEINERMSERVADMYSRIAQGRERPELIDQLPSVEPAPSSVVERAVTWLKERGWS